MGCAVGYSLHQGLDALLVGIGYFAGVTVLFTASRNIFLIPSQNQEFTYRKQEYPDLYTCLAATLTAVN